MSEIIFFILAVIGCTNIIVDPATIMIKPREWIEKYGPNWLNKLLSCYQCTGTWVGFFCGYALISNDPLVILCCGFAGSCAAVTGATFLTYLQAKTEI